MLGSGFVANLIQGDLVEQRSKWKSGAGSLCRLGEDRSQGDSQFKGLEVVNGTVDSRSAPEDLGVWGYGGQGGSVGRVYN